MSEPVYLEIGDDAFVRTFTPDDAAAVYEVLDAERERLGRWFSWVPATRSVQDQRTWIERSLASEHDREANGIWLAAADVAPAARDRAAAVLAGAIGLSVNPLDNGGEIGYWLAGRHEGRGLVTRAAVAMIDLAFDRLGLHRIQVRAAVSNERSRAVAERLGMTHEGVLREQGSTGIGTYEDMAVYGVLDREWPDLRARVLR